MDDLERQLLEAQQDWLDLDDTESANLALSAVVRLRTYREALQPFADCCDQISDDEDDEEWAKFRLLIKDYRRARQALKG